MRGLKWKTILVAAIAGSGIFLAAGAQARDDDHWGDEHWRAEHRRYVEEHEHWRHDPPRPVVYERPPVVVAPAPVIMAAPVAPIFSPPSSLNLNFNIPLR